MTEQILIWALGILTTLFGGLNIFQWITLQSYKRLKRAEADRLEIENLRLVIQTIQNSTQAEINRLQKRVEEAERIAMENSNKYISLQQEFETYKQKHK